MATQANPFGATTRLAITTVALDPMTSRALAHFLLAVPGVVVADNLESYHAAEWEVGRAGEQARTRICFIDLDQNLEQAIRLAEHLRDEHPEVNLFSVSVSNDAERIIAVMRAG